MKKVADMIGSELTQVAGHNSDIYVLDGDLADSDGAHHFATTHPERFLMAGISEQHMVSMAAGLASVGKRPFVFSFAAFLCFRAFDQIRVCLSQARQPVTLVGSHAGGLSGRNGKSHSAPNDIAVMSTLSNVCLWAPLDSKDVSYMLCKNLEDNSPNYIRCSRVPVNSECNYPGRGPLRWLRPKGRINIVAYGISSLWAMEVADTLSKKGLKVGVLHCLCVSDIAAITEELQGTEKLVVYEDHIAVGGLGSKLLPYFTDIPSRHFAWPDNMEGESGDEIAVLKHYGMSADCIARQMSEWLISVTIQHTALASV